ncbi:MAG: RNA-binding protein [candidate division Zixibacteria bacterium]|nr:RNA-binding protein [candidate division Zixibacteria bacterium]
MDVSKLYVGNLNYSVTSEQLKELFSNHGDVKDVRVIDGKGFGFVEMSSVDEAETAKDALNGSEFEGRTLRIDEARPRRENNNRRGGGGGYNRY